MFYNIIKLRVKSHYALKDFIKFQHENCNIYTKYNFLTKSHRINSNIVDMASVTSTLGHDCSDFVNHSHCGIMRQQHHNITQYCTLAMAASTAIYLFVESFL